MKKLTAEEILQIVKDNYEISKFAFGEFTNTKIEVLTEAELEELKSQGTRSDYWNNYQKSILNKLGLGTIIEVEQYGGGYQGDDWYSVKFFENHGIYIRTDGYNQSYDYVDFGGYGYGYEVVPKKKVITIYERVKR